MRCCFCKPQPVAGRVQAADCHSVLSESMQLHANRLVHAEQNCLSVNDAESDGNPGRLRERKKNDFPPLGDMLTMTLVGSKAAMR